MRDGSPDRRPFSKLKLYIGEIGNNRKSELMRVFDKYGPIKSFYVDDTKKFGFVEYASTRDATEALRRTDGKNVNGARIRVEFARRDNRLPTDLRKANNFDRRQHHSSNTHQHFNLQQRNAKHDRRHNNYTNRHTTQYRSPNRRRHHNSYYNQKRYPRSRSNESRRSLSMDSRIPAHFSPAGMQLPAMLTGTTAGGFMPPFPYPAAAFDPYAAASAAFQMGLPSLTGNTHIVQPSLADNHDSMQNSIQLVAHSDDHTKDNSDDRRKRKRRRHRSNSEVYTNSSTNLVGSQTISIPDASVSIDFPQGGRNNLEENNAVLSNSGMLHENDDDRRSLALPHQQHAAASLMNSPYLSPAMFHAMYQGFLPPPGAQYPSLGFPPNHPMMMSLIQQQQQHDASSKDNSRRSERHSRRRNKSKRRRHHEKKISRHTRRYKQRNSHHNDDDSDHRQHSHRVKLRSSDRNDRPNCHRDDDRRNSEDSSSSYSSRSPSYSCDERSIRSNADISDTEQTENRRKSPRRDSFDDSSPVCDQSSNANSSPMSRNSVDNDFRDKNVVKESSDDHSQRSTEEKC